MDMQEFSKGPAMPELKMWVEPVSMLWVRYPPARHVFEPEPSVSFL